MADTLRIKRRAAGGAAGPPATLKSAEIAFNEQDNTLYYGKGDSGGNATSIIAIAGDAKASKNTDAPQHGRLGIVSATQIKFVPYGGDLIKIAGVLYTILSAGITAANTSVFVNGTGGQNLAASTVYLVTVFNNAGTPTINFQSAISHVADTTAGNVGVEVLTGGGTYHTLVGMIRTNASSQFQDDVAFRGVLSWFNRRNLVLTGASTGGTGTTSASMVEITSAARAYFLSWADEAALMGVAGSILSGAVGTGGCQLGYDGASLGQAAFATIGTAGWWGGGTTFMVGNPTETMHYITVMGQGGGVTMNFYASCYGMIRG